MPLPVVFLTERMELGLNSRPQRRLQYLIKAMPIDGGNVELWLAAPIDVSGCRARIPIEFVTLSYVN